MTILQEINEMEQIVDEFAKCGRLTPSETHIFHRIGNILRMMENSFVWEAVYHDKMVEENNKLRAKIEELEGKNESENNN